MCETKYRKNNDLGYRIACIEKLGLLYKVNSRRGEQVRKKIFPLTLMCCNYVR